MILRRLIPLPPEEKEPSKTELIWMAASYIGRLMLLLQEEGHKTQTQRGLKNDS